MAGIDTKKERNIFEYRPKIERPIPDVIDPTDPTPPVPITEVLDTRHRILSTAINTDSRIDALQKLVDAQLGNMKIGVSDDTPDLQWAIQQLGGDGIDYDLYNKALNLLKNASIASMCVDPVHLVFAESSPDGPLIPRVKTKTPTCEEASDPNLFDSSGVNTEDTIPLDSAMDQFQQMTLYRILLMTWWGMQIFSLRVILRMVESAIRAMGGRIKGRLLKPIRNILKRVARFLRKLICWAEKKVFGRHLSSFCKDLQPEEPYRVEDDIHVPVGGPAKGVCYTLIDEDGNAIEVPKKNPKRNSKVAVTTNSITGPNGVTLIVGGDGFNPVYLTEEQERALGLFEEEDDPDTLCMIDDNGEEGPEGEGCPILIPAECIKAARQIVDRVNKWALNSETTSGDVNPAAVFVGQSLNSVVEAHEAAKFMLVSQDDSPESDTLVKNTIKKPFHKNRYSHPMVQKYLNNTRPSRVIYGDGSADPTHVDTRENC